MGLEDTKLDSTVVINHHTYFIRLSMIPQVRCYLTHLLGRLMVDNLTRSAGDNPRRVFLGVSNTVGIDVDFTSYKGKQNPTNLGYRN